MGPEVGGFEPLAVWRRVRWANKPASGCWELEVEAGRSCVEVFDDLSDWNEKRRPGFGFVVVESIVRRWGGREMVVRFWGEG